MRIEKKFKPSHHKANARYRGVTEHSQYTNFVLESARDLLVLGNITTGNEKTGDIGHEKAIENNFISVMTGDENVSKSNLFTAATMQKINRSRQVNVPMLSSWLSLNEATITQNGDGSVRIASAGLKDPVGAMTGLYVEPGEILYIRFKAKAAAGAPAFSFGSNNIRINPELNGDTKKMALAASSEYVTVDHTLRIGYAETINLNLNVHESPALLQATAIDIKDLEVYYLDESAVQLAAYDRTIKPGIDELEEKINSIR